MTTKELIHRLEQFPPELRVVVNGYEEGYDDLSPDQLSVVDIALNIGKHRWQGMHGDLTGFTRRKPEDAEVVEALVLQRLSN